MSVYDPVSDEFRRDRYGVYRRLRDDHPVYADPAGRFHTISRFDDVRRASVDWKTFSAVTAESKVLRPIINDMDPPLHTDRRGNLARAFTPRRVAEMETGLRALARRLIDGFASKGECDFVAEFAAQFPSLVMANLLGLPDDVIDECRAITDAVMRIDSPEGNASPAARCDAVFAPLIEQRRAAPGPDLISALLAVGDQGGEALPDDEILGFCFLLLVGGNDTTTNLLGNGMDLLDRHPDQLAEIVADASLLTEAIEEMSRCEAPTQTSARQTTCEVEVSGTVIPADQRVLLMWNAANLDEREFTDPERFDIHRGTERHLTFGHGAHFCMGAALARLELRVAFEELLRVMPTFRIVERSERIRSVWAWGFDSLQIEFPVNA